MKPILEIHNISKIYRIMSGQGPYLNLRDLIASTFGFGNKPNSTRWGRSKTQTEDFYALSNVSFDVNEGDAVGIVGSNGAGKSTLLKVISKITPPSYGKIIVRGRVASLLEVGTGFHAELTGRENIFLNGSILGMKRKEILAKFEEIVDFSGVEKFIDTPIKHYSSGMQLRLAFAVAAFLEPEILLIDEVLAVGDVEFQKKCLGKMDEVHRSGRTVLFVSHNMSAVKTLCQKCICISDGKLVEYGLSEEVVSNYLKMTNTEKSELILSDDEEVVGDNVAVLRSAKAIDEDHNPVQGIYIHKKIGIEFTYEVLESGYNPIPNIYVYKATGECAFTTSESNNPLFKQKGVIKTTLWIPENLLNIGMYNVGIALSTFSPEKVHFFLQDALVFETLEDLSLRNVDYNNPLPGVVKPILKWESEKIESETL